MDELCTILVRQPVVRRVEIPPVIKLWLIARVEQHRFHAVLVGQREVEHLELDWDLIGSSVGVDGDRAAVGRGLSIATDVERRLRCA